MFKVVKNEAIYAKGRVPARCGDPTTFSKYTNILRTSTGRHASPPTPPVAAAATARACCCSFSCCSATVSGTKLAPKLLPPPAPSRRSVRGRSVSPTCPGRGEHRARGGSLGAQTVGFRPDFELACNNLKAGQRAAREEPRRLLAPARPGASGDMAPVCGCRGSVPDCAVPSQPRPRVCARARPKNVSKDGETLLRGTHNVVGGATEARDRLSADMSTHKGKKKMLSARFELARVSASPLKGDTLTLRTRQGESHSDQDNFLAR